MTTAMTRRNGNCRPALFTMPGWDDLFPRDIFRSPVFDTFFSMDSIGGAGAGRSARTKEDGKVVIRIDVPGVKKEAISLSIQGDMLVTEWERNGTKTRHVEAIPPGIRDADACLEDGVLTITMDDTESPKPIKIGIR